MNPRQRRGVLLMIVAAAAAIMVFVMVVSYVNQVRAQVGEMVRVLKLTTSVPANTQVSANDLKTVDIPKSWAPTTLLSSVTQTIGKVAATDIPAGALLDQGMLKAQPALQPDQREIAIMVDAETGVAGQVHPGDIVDVYAAFPSQGTTGTGNQTTPNCAIRVLTQVQVLLIGNLVNQPGTNGQQIESVPVTFALSPQESTVLSYAEAFASKLRLALVNTAPNQPNPPQRQCGDPTAQ